jgi:hypothetical protein
VARDGKSHTQVKIDEIKSVIKSHKGQNLSVILGKQLKTRKRILDSAMIGDNEITITGESPVVEKVTSIVIRGGIEYDNQKVVIEGREDGTLPDENQGLPWGEWAEYPFHITHKGSDYARFYAASGLSFEPKVEYYLNGKLSTKAIVEPLCLASEFRKSDEPMPLCMTIKADNVKAIVI